MAEELQDAGRRVFPIAVIFGAVAFIRAFVNEDLTGALAAAAIAGGLVLIAGTVLLASYYRLRE